jgi:hypothetical protein
VEQAPKLSREEATTGLKVSSARHTRAHVRARTRMDRPVTVTAGPGRGIHRSLCRQQARPPKPLLLLARPSPSRCVSVHVLVCICVLYAFVSVAVRARAYTYLGSSAALTEAGTGRENRQKSARRGRDHS